MMAENGDDGRGWGRVHKSPVSFCLAAWMSFPNSIIFLSKRVDPGLDGLLVVFLGLLADGEGG